MRWVLCGRHIVPFTPTPSSVLLHVVRHVVTRLRVPNIAPLQSVVADIVFSLSLYSYQLGPMSQRMSPLLGGAPSTAQSQKFVKIGMYS